MTIFFGVAPQLYFVNINFKDSKMHQESFSVAVLTAKIDTSTEIV